MTGWQIVGLVLVWWAFGFAYMVYSWTKRYDLTLYDLFMSIACGALGPLAIAVVAIADCDDIVLLRARR